MDDDYAGQGGAFIINPETGKRELVERTQETDEKAADPETTEE